MRRAVPFLALLVTSTVGCAAAGGPTWAEPAMPPPRPTFGWSSPPPQAPPPYQWGRASFYSDRLAGRRTATGEPYDPGALTAAHRTLPFGTIVDVARSDGRHVTVRINDRGPYAAGRIIDLSRRAATELGIVRAGVADVVLRVMWAPST